MTAISAATVSVPTPNMQVCKMDRLGLPGTMVKRQATRIDKAPANNPAIDPQRKVTTMTAAKKVPNGRPVASIRKNKGAKIACNAPATTIVATATT